MLWLGSVLEDLAVDPLVGEFVVGNLRPVDWLVLADGGMDEGELSVVAHLVHLPLFVPGVVVREGLLAVLVAVWQLEDLSVEVLLLLRDEERDLGLLDVLREDVDRVLRELEVLQLLLLQLALLHVDHLGQEVVVAKGLVVEDVGHLRFD